VLNCGEIDSAILRKMCRDFIDAELSKGGNSKGRAEGED
jgi:hypothetical protein